MLVSACSGDPDAVDSRASSTSFRVALGRPVRYVTNVRLLSAVVPNSSYDTPGGTLTVDGTHERPLAAGNYGTPAGLAVAVSQALSGLAKVVLGDQCRLSVEGVSSLTASDEGLSLCLGLPLVADPSGGWLGSGPCCPGAATPSLYVVSVRELPAPGLVAHVPRARDDSITYHRPASGDAQRDRVFAPPLACLRSLTVDIRDERGRLWDLNGLDVDLLFEIRGDALSPSKKNQRQVSKKKKNLTNQRWPHRTSD